LSIAFLLRVGGNISVISVTRSTKMFAMRIRSLPVAALRVRRERRCNAAAAKDEGISGRRVSLSARLAECGSALFPF
jgi:hypothetical protein